jgi:ribonuclease P protein component
VCYWAVNALENNRLGLVASKKVGNSVKRSRAKRVIREAFRLAEPELRQKSDTRYDFVFVARGKTPDLKSTRIYDQIMILMDGL